jgi:hypothetical protein
MPSFARKPEALLFEGNKPFCDYEWMDDAIMPSL